MRGLLRERFDAKWLKSTEHSYNGTACWDWQGHLGEVGYGRIGVREFGGWFIRYAHRVGYELYIGADIGNLDCHHLCQRRKCVRPEHIELLTHSEHSGRHGRLRPYRLCVRGHALAGDNLRINTQGSRVCIYCARSADALLYHRKRVARFEAIGGRTAREDVKLDRDRRAVAEITTERDESRAAMRGQPRY
jgi:hypothetical protein